MNHEEPTGLCWHDVVQPFLTDFCSLVRIDPPVSDLNVETFVPWRRRWRHVLPSAALQSGR